MATRRSIRGVLLVLAIFVIGGVMLAGLYLAPRPSSPKAPAGAIWGVPNRTLKFASYNILHNQRGFDAIVAEIKKLDADFVLLQEVEYADAAALATAVGMSERFSTRQYETSVNLAGPRASWGNLILSKHPLYECASIPNPGGGSFGVWAVAEIDGKKFIVANVHLSATWNAKPKHLQESGVNRNKELTALLNAWRDRGAPPMVAGGDFNQIPMGNNYALMTQEWSDAMKAISHTGTTFGDGFLQTRIDYFLTTKQWKPLDGGIVTSKASDHRPIWITLDAADAK